MGSYRVPEAASLWTDPTLDHLEPAILCTVAYSDVFDYPLTVSQIHRYLVGVATNRREVVNALDAGGWASQRVERHGLYVTLPGRGELVKIRERRGEIGTQMWESALRYGRAIAGLPFVRAVALTGALALNNVEPGDDLDYLIVTAADRLWLTRAIIIGLVVRPAGRRGHEVCPNYLLSERSLEFQEENLYVAHELAQMVPMAGLQIYRRLRRTNRWAARFLPNARGPSRHVELGLTHTAPRRTLTELALSTCIGGQLERLERRRKIHRFTAHRKKVNTTCFTADRCKGHFESNEQTILKSFDERLSALARL